MNKDVEIDERSSVHTFQYGVSSYILDSLSIGDSWYIAMSRTLHIALCTSDSLQPATKQRLTRAFKLMFKVHAGLRLSILKSDAP